MQAIAQNGKERFDIEHIDGKESEEHEDGDSNEEDSDDEQLECDEESAVEECNGTTLPNGARVRRERAQVIEMVSHAHSSMRDSDTRHLQQAIRLITVAHSHITALTTHTSTTRTVDSAGTGTGRAGGRKADEQRNTRG